MKKLSMQADNGAEVGGEMKDIGDLSAAPRDRRILFHMVQEVRRHDKVDIRFTFSLTPDPEADKNLKAGILSAFFISTTKNVIPPQHKLFRHSERYGHFVYFGLKDDKAKGEFSQQLIVPYHANQLVVSLMPFANATTRLSGITIESGLAV
jgi:hypothetical protein